MKKVPTVPAGIWSTCGIGIPYVGTSQRPGRISRLARTIECMSRTIAAAAKPGPKRSSAFGKVAVVKNEERRYTHLGQLSDVAFELKSYGKTFQGSAVVKERRGGHEHEEGAPDIPTEADWPADSTQG